MTFHILHTDITPPESMNYPFCYEPDSLSLLAAEGVKTYLLSHAEWLPVLQEGKMFGILVVEKDGVLGFLAAYSGQVAILEGDSFFVPPVFDYLQPDGYFKQEEAMISHINHDISMMENGSTPDVSADVSSVIRDLKNQRRQRSQALQRWLFSRFVMLNANGDRRSLLDIFRDTPLQFPPSGAGECCAPKLLQYAYLHGMRPLRIAEFWWGDSPKKEIRHHLHFYPACRGRCLPILSFMMQGLDVESDPQQTYTHASLRIVYEDAHILVVDKPSGMLSVPGKLDRPSVLSTLRLSHPNIMLCHRLDMDTSGLLVAAKDEATYKDIQKQFLDRTVKKRYRAIVIPKTPERLHPGDKGTIDLPLASDYMERPCQVVDYEHGKRAITEWRVESISPSSASSAIGVEVSLLLVPHTGRTHQLRVHCASPYGLNAPIKGDPLYGQRADRLHLYAVYLEFTHPATGERMRFTLK
ncbi:MAG: RluA family pseudouridine synthase [Prevotella sp.]|nr:RluA family pseudouridine synthase [Prevotella sp.]